MKKKNKKDLLEWREFDLESLSYGDIIHYKKRVWMINRISSTFIHNHFFVELRRRSYGRTFYEKVMKIDKPKLKTCCDCDYKDGK